MNSLEKGDEIMVRKKPLVGAVDGRRFRRRSFRAVVQEVRPDQGGAIVVDVAKQTMRFAAFDEITAPTTPARASPCRGRRRRTR